MAKPLTKAQRAALRTLARLEDDYHVFLFTSQLEDVGIKSRTFSALKAKSPAVIKLIPPHDADYPRDVVQITPTGRAALKEASE